MYGLSRQ